MEWLQLVAVPIRDLSVLRRMARLRRLDIAYTPVTDVSVLAGLHHLDTLHLDNTKVRDVSCLRGHPMLRELKLPKDADYSTLMTDEGFVLPNPVKVKLGERAMVLR